jgi:hypothetical protein
MLVEKGAIEYMPDCWGNSPLEYAGKFKHDKITEYLIIKSYRTIKKLLRQNNKG